MTRLRSLLLVGSALALAACQGAVNVASPGEGVIIPPTPTPTPPPTPTPGPDADCPTGTVNVGIVAGLRNCQISGTISGNLLLPFRSGTYYSLSGQVNVGADVGGDGTKPGGATATLNIEPGVVIFGSSGADFIVVQRGSRINAVGTASRPIVFTSRQNIEGTAGANSIGLWGGMVLLGRAPINRCIAAGVPGGSAGCEAQVEGFTGGFFGGALPNDTSGQLKFVQIRYPGFEVAPGNELNGITLGGVGAGTVFENVQVYNSSDDGYEWFGGRVNGKYLVIQGIDDDGIDTDQGYKGVNQFVLVFSRTAGGDRGIEADTSGNDNFVPRSNPLFANLTIVQNNANATAAVILQRGGTDFRIYNTIVTTNVTNKACVQMANPFTIAGPDAALDKVGPPVYRSTFFSCPGGPSQAGSGITTAQINAVLDGSNTTPPTVTNNVLNGTSQMTNGGFAAGAWFPGANELAVPVTAVAGINPYLVNTTYIGAFSGTSDTWYNGWTCGLGGTTPSCETVPTPKS